MDGARAPERLWSGLPTLPTRPCQPSLLTMPTDPPHPTAPNGTALPAAPAPLHLLVVDDHAVVRLGLVQLLRGLREGVEVSEAADLAQAQAVLAARPDVALVVLDVHLPGQPPLAALQVLRSSRPLLPVVMLSADTDRDLAAQALRAGAAGWLAKAADARVLLSALSLVLEGGCYVPPFLLQRDSALAAETLTERQVEVLGELVQGRSNKEIARALGMAEPTVKGHLVTIFRVLRVRNRAEAVSAGQARLRALSGFR